MLTFKSFLSEEVVPTAFVHDGVIDLQKDSVRDNINIILRSLGSKMYVTPYSGLQHISKALAQFHIILPKRTFMEGSRGIEVYEMRQFGNVIGMNDQGKFINDVPVKYFLVVRYQLVGLGMFQVFAKVVEQSELNGLMNQMEKSLAEAKDIPDSDEVPFKGGHKIKPSSEDPMSHAHRLAVKAKARIAIKDRKKLEENKQSKMEVPKQDDNEDDERKKKQKDMVVKALHSPVQQSMDQMVRKVRQKVGKVKRHK